MIKRPIVIISIGYIIGILLGVYLESMSLFCIFIMIILAIIKYKNKSIVLFLLVCVISNIITNILIKDYEKIYNIKEEKYIGIIVSNKVEKKYKDVYYIKINNRKFILNVKKKKNVELEIGDKIIFDGIYEKPSEISNYKGFDYSKYLKSKKIYGQIELNGKVKIVSKRNNFLKYYIYKLKKYINKNIDEKINEKQAGILKAMLIGETQGLENNIKENFSKSSLSHMLAISGAHINYIIMIVSIIIQKNKNKKRLLVIAILIIFMNLIGFTPSVMRASIMNITYLISKLLNRKNDVINSLALSIFLILFSNPFNIFDIGFLLSYGGTIGIIFFYEKIEKYLEKKIKFKNKFISYIIQSISISFSAQIIIFPIMLVIFGNISLNFCIFNILASPILCLIIFSGIVFVILPINFNRFIVEMFINILIMISNLSNIIPLSKLYIPIPSIFSMGIIYLNIIMIHLKRFKLKFCAITIMIVILFETLLTIPNGMKIYFVDVGQGDCTIIKTERGKNILIDAGGGRDNNEYDVGKNVVLPYLLNRKINKLDYMIISHFDSDHCNGCEYILKNIKVKNLIISKQAKITNEYTNIINIAKRKNVRIIYVKEKDIIKIDSKTFFEIYHPSDKLIGDDINENSIVTKLVYKCRKKDFTMLFVGDIEKGAEEIIVNKRVNLKADILKVGHHGSKTSSTEKFLEKVSPKIALIGVGKDNNFGHPNTDVIYRMENLRYKSV